MICILLLYCHVCVGRYSRVFAEHVEEIEAFVRRYSATSSKVHVIALAGRYEPRQKRQQREINRRSRRAWGKATVYMAVCLCVQSQGDVSLERGARAGDLRGAIVSHRPFISNVYIFPQRRYGLCYSRI